MESHDRRWPLPRRSFFARLGLGLAAVTGTLAAQPASAQSSPARTPFSPARHAVDDWLDEVPGKHRLYLDTTTVDGIAHAIFWSNNFLTASRSGYELADADSAIVICVRHESTPFAFTDAMWAKYGAALAEHANFKDPSSGGVPAINLLQSAQMRTMANRGVTMDTVLKRGVRLAVCSLATRAIAGVAARQTGKPIDDIVKELTANVVTNGHMVPAGIVALNRAQERGYTSGYIA